MMSSSQSPALAEADARPIFGIRFTRKTFNQILDESAALPAPGSGVKLLIAVNLDCIVLLRRHPDLARAYNSAYWRTIDGAPVYLYGKLRKIGMLDKITGSDLLPKVLERSQPGAHRLFFVVATDEIAERLKAWGAKHGFAPDAVQVDVPPFGFERDQAYSADLAARIRLNNTTHLVFGLGAPKSEVWIDDHRAELGDCHAFCVGAGVAFFVGTTRRAPVAFRRVGMEWLWRVGQDPKRLARRYFLHSWGFVHAVAADLGGKPATE
jgi:N-acetylglucosaminyldiphosphoundecaprenol N-acetyl-beta-D-mannosaminyltransferase